MCKCYEGRPGESKVIDALTDLRVDPERSSLVRLVAAGACDSREEQEDVLAVLEEIQQAIRGDLMPIRG